MATVESVAFDLDYRSKITRSQFETDNITSVILTGGSSRTPIIQAAVKVAVGESKIALNVNADEAAVLGAALHGAGLSRQFKTKDIRVSDIGLHDIQVSYPAEMKTSSSKPRTINTMIFPTGSKTGSKKTLTFKRQDDFSLKLAYKASPGLGFPTDILEAGIVGVREAIQNLTDLGAIDPIVKATVVLSESGFASVRDAIAFGEFKDESLAGKLKGFFGGSSSTEEPSADAETTADEQSSAAYSSPTASTKATPKDEPISLDVEVKFSSIAPMTVAEKRRARDRHVFEIILLKCAHADAVDFFSYRLVTVDNEEAAKRRREDARNTLEGYLYRVRDLLEDDSSDSPFRKCSQEVERKAMAEKLEETLAWLHDLGDDADTIQYIDKRNAVESLERPVVHRYKEIEEFPKALNNSQMWNWSTRLFLTEAKSNLTKEEQGGPPSRYTKEELNGLEKTLIDHEKWLNEWVEKQKSVKMNEDPVILSSEMRARAKTLENHLQKLVKKKTPKPPKKTKTATATVTDQEPLETEGTSSSGTSSSEPPAASEAPAGHDEL
ncbi:Heat shock protein 17 [Grifola frondosa]|uniref:Heat shock protein 17 n=1 Tax=Grifola frondosa TaxID=5627 RepID=A0A1C7MCN1_GRIFR|nr:Heat shock protein 17 [Grifola frondosa]